MAYSIGGGIGKKQHNGGVKRWTLKWRRLA